MKTFEKINNLYLPGALEYETGGKFDRGEMEEAILERLEWDESPFEAAIVLIYPEYDQESDSYTGRHNYAVDLIANRYDGAVSVYRVDMGRDDPEEILRECGHDIEYMAEIWYASHIIDGIPSGGEYILDEIGLDI